MQKKGNLPCRPRCNPPRQCRGGRSRQRTNGSPGSAAWLGWTLDAFDFTIFLLIMVPISQEFGVPLTEVASVFTVTLWMRLVGADASGWLADRIGRKKPLMISILWYSVCNFIAGFSPTFWFLLLFRALLGIGMGAEWPAGAALAMETWPARSRGFMGGVLQGSWGLGFAAVECRLRLALRRDRLARPAVDRRPAGLAVVYRPLLRQGAAGLGREPAAAARRRHARSARRCSPSSSAALLGNTLTACWWMASGFVTYYSINALFATHLQKDFGLSPGDGRAADHAGERLVVFLACGVLGLVSDQIGRRWAMIIPALLAIPVGAALSADHRHIRGS